MSNKYNDVPLDELEARMLDAARRTFCYFISMHTCKVCGRKTKTDDRSLVEHKRKYHDHANIFDILGNDWRNY